VADVARDGVRADHECVRDLAIRATCGKEPEDLDLALGEAVGIVGAGLAA